MERNKGDWKALHQLINTESVKQTEKHNSLVYACCSYNYRDFIDPDKLLNSSCSYVVIFDIADTNQLELCREQGKIPSYRILS